MRIRMRNTEYSVLLFWALVSALCTLGIDLLCIYDVESADSLSKQKKGFERKHNRINLDFI